MIGQCPIPVLDSEYCGRCHYPHTQFSSECPENMSSTSLRMLIDKISQSKKPKKEIAINVEDLRKVLATRLKAKAEQKKNGR
jgi:hypothetical protein